MKLHEHVPLAPLTTLGVGGEAHFFGEAQTDGDIEEAITHARAHMLPLYLLGAGSNLLVPDEGVEGVVVKITMHDILFQDEGDTVLLIADAGAPWGKIVDAANARGLFGIQNLAGIPGTMGGAVVQNIGAYGAELADVFAYADVIDSTSGIHSQINRTDAAFGYRTSFFKKYRALIIARAALCLSKKGTPNLSYPDLAGAHASGAPLATPAEISCAVRAIRADKFPNSPDEGTAGSFFKNPIVDEKTLARLRVQYPGFPAYPVSTGGGKISLAWLFDHALSLKGYAKGNVRLYEKQPLVVVARAGATAAEVDAFACDIAKYVYDAIGIIIEREVETFGRK